MIHQYKFGGLNIVLDVCSGGVHVVDDLAYDMISIFENAEREEDLGTPRQYGLTQFHKHLPEMKKVYLR